MTKQKNLNLASTVTTKIGLCGWRSCTGWVRKNVGHLTINILVKTGRIGSVEAYFAGEFELRS